MRTKYVLGCLGLLGLISGVLCTGGAVRWLRVPVIEIPPRKYPPNNAYESYRALAQRMSADLGADGFFNEVEQRLFPMRGSPTADAADRAYYLQRMSPYLKEYTLYLDSPSVAVFEYDANWLMPEMVHFRRIARAEALLMEEELRRGQSAAAVQRARRLTRFAEQIRNDGALIHYLVGIAINAIAIDSLRKELPNLRDSKALRAIVQMVRDYEKHRTPMLRSIQHEYYFGLSVYRDLATGRLSYDQLAQSEPADNPLSSSSAWFLPSTRIMVNTALPEYRQLMKQVIDEFKKPCWARSRTEPSPKHPLNALLLPVFSQASLKEVHELALMRLLGCAAAIRLFKQRTGRYPTTLDELQLGQMIIDPYSGKPFIYRTHPAKGFLLYSVSANRVDDGGWSPYRSVAISEGDLIPVRRPLPKSLRHQNSGQRLCPPVWLK
ncbi:hypothetical protein HRbin15_01170 [bacterium HR15]|nr:hypothetical protein HRbin15_01170 [bacterium HR15]